MIDKTIRDQIQITEEEEVGAATAEVRQGIMMTEITIKEEEEEVSDQEEEEDTEEEETNEVSVGRILLPLPRRSLWLGQEANQPNH